MKLIPSNIRYTLFILIYKFSFDLVYVYNISKSFAYRGCVLDFDLFKYICLTFLFIFFIKPTISLYSKADASSIAVLLLTFMYFIPGLSLLTLTNVGSGFVIFYFLYWALVLFWNKILVHIKMPKLKRSQANILFNLFIICSVIIVLAISGVYTGFRLHFNIFDVYSLRAEERDLNLPLLIKYLQPMLAAIVPCLALYFFTRKKIKLSVLFILLQLLMFGIGGHKSYLFAMFVAILTYLFYKRKRLVYLPLCFVFLNTIALLEGSFKGGKSIIASLIQYRVQVVPNLISYHMHDFMQTHEYLYLRESILRFLGFTSPYKPNYFFVIGEEYFGDAFTQANTGLCGDAFSQFGYLSLLVYPMLIPLCFSILASICKKMDEKIVFIVVFLFIGKFINGSFFSVLLTNGFIMVLIILFLLSSKIADFKK